jgi:glycosyltransferase involved in cell wall biosynthesis
MVTKLDVVSETRPLVSVVTPTLNQAAFIEETLQSVERQDYPRIEHIVVDGGSTDGTLDILRRWGGRWISEPDDGQGRALQKGIDLTNGEILGWLNSDDLYAPGAIKRAVAGLESAELVYGDARIIDRDGVDQGLAGNVEPFDLWRLVNVTDFIVQPAAFFTRSAYASAGGIDPSLHYCLDYDLWIRLGRAFPVRYIPEVLALARVHGDAKTANGGVRRLDEIEQMIQRYGSRTLPTRFEGEMGREAWKARQFRRAVPYLARTLAHRGVRPFIGAAARHW